MRRENQPAQWVGHKRAKAGSNSESFVVADEEASLSLGAKRTLVDSVRDEFTFFRGFLLRPYQVGSVVPSSSLLEADLVRVAGIADARCVVEFGPGTGGTTRAILRAMRPSSCFLAVELSEFFHSRLKATTRDHRLIAQVGSAERVADFLSAWRLPAPDAIVSGIPFSTMPPAVAERVANAVAETLAPGGRFVAYQFREHVVNFVSPRLGAPVQHWQWLNIPPVRVFCWRKPPR